MFDYRRVHTWGYRMEAMGDILHGYGHFTMGMRHLDFLGVGQKEWGRTMGNKDGWGFDQDGDRIGI